MGKNKVKDKKKRRKTALITMLVIVVVFAAAFLVGWNWIEKEHSVMRDMKFEDIDISKIDDGVYEGYYEGGTYGWRENRVSVTVKGGKIESIDVIYSKEGLSAEFTDELNENVMDSQSLDVDTVSEATLTSKGYLKAVENALMSTND